MTDTAPPPIDPALAAAFPEYALDGVLGEGGMGLVLRARRRADGVAIALKLLAPGHADDAQARDRFAREQAIARQLDHPGLVRVVDGGLRAGRPWLAMALVEGATLRQVLRDGGDGGDGASSAAGALPPAEALRIAGELTAAVGALHAHGIVHRDIKPENVLLDRAGRVQLTDFGLACVIQAPAAAGLTRTGTMLGTPHYAAPEQWADARAAGPRADLYAVGVVLYEMLTGRLPLGRFDPPSRLAAVPRQVDAIVLRCLARDPARRWPDADALAQALRAAADLPEVVDGATAQARRSAQAVARGRLIAARQEQRQRMPWLPAGSPVVLLIPFLVVLVLISSGAAPFVTALSTAPVGWLLVGAIAATMTAGAAWLAHRSAALMATAMALWGAAALAAWGSLPPDRHGGMTGTTPVIAGTLVIAAIAWLRRSWRAPTRVRQPWWPWPTAGLLALLMLPLVPGPNPAQLRHVANRPEFVAIVSRGHHWGPAAAFASARAADFRTPTEQRRQWRLALARAHAEFAAAASAAHAAPIALARVAAAMSAFDLLLDDASPEHRTVSSDALLTIARAWADGVASVAASLEDGHAAWPGPDLDEPRVPVIPLALGANDWLHPVDAAAPLLGDHDWALARAVNLVAERVRLGRSPADAAVHDLLAELWLTCREAELILSASGHHPQRQALADLLSTRLLDPERALPPLRRDRRQHPPMTAAEADGLLARLGRTAAAPARWFRLDPRWWQRVEVVASGVTAAELLDRLAGEVGAPLAPWPAGVRDRLQTRIDVQALTTRHAAAIAIAAMTGTRITPFGDRIVVEADDRVPVPERWIGALRVQFSPLQQPIGIGHDGTLGQAPRSSDSDFDPPPAVDLDAAGLIRLGRALAWPVLITPQARAGSGPALAVPVRIKVPSSWDKVLHDWAVAHRMEPLHLPGLTVLMPARPAFLSRGKPFDSNRIRPEDLADDGGRSFPWLTWAQELRR